MHGKRRKGLERQFGQKNLLICQTEQDRIFFKYFLKEPSPGLFWEVGCGDGTTGSPTLYLEQMGWRGFLWEKQAISRSKAQARRSNPVMGAESATLQSPTPDFLAIRKPGEVSWIWNWLQSTTRLPAWVSVENPRPSMGWLHRLKKRGYLLRWFFHDDEYYCLGPR